jgi:hypothetical protein
LSGGHKHSFKFQVSSFKPERSPKSNVQSRCSRQLWTLDFRLK